MEKYCSEFEKLENDFIAARRETRRRAAANTLNDRLQAEMDRREITALFKLLDHRAEHGCQREPTT